MKWIALTGFVLGVGGVLMYRRSVRPRMRQLAAQR